MMQTGIVGVMLRERNTIVRIRHKACVSDIVVRVHPRINLHFGGVVDAVMKYLTQQLWGI